MAATYALISFFIYIYIYKKEGTDGTEEISVDNFLRIAVPLLSRKCPVSRRSPSLLGYLRG
jgi:hypothetical protein